MPAVTEVGAGTAVRERSGLVATRRGAFGWAHRREAGERRDLADRDDTRRGDRQVALRQLVPQRDVALAMAGGLQPVRGARITIGDDEGDRTVVVEVRVLTREAREHVLVVERMIAGQESTSGEGGDSNHPQHERHRKRAPPEHPGGGERDRERKRQHEVADAEGR